MFLSISHHREVIILLFLSLSLIMQGGNYLFLHLAKSKKQRCKINQKEHFGALIEPLFRDFGKINCRECHNKNASPLYNGFLNGTLLRTPPGKCRRCKIISQQ